jgi:hypothetical protein
MDVPGDRRYSVPIDGFWTLGDRCQEDEQTASYGWARTLQREFQSILVECLLALHGSLFNIPMTATDTK